MKRWAMYFVLLLLVISKIRAESYSSNVEAWKGGEGIEEIGEQLWVEEEEDEEIGIEMWGSKESGKNPVNVDSFGAVGDGRADDTQAFINAWAKACSLENAVFLIPDGRQYKVNATKFKGPCQDKITIQIEGTIIAPDDPKQWDPKSQRNWLTFNKLTGIRFQGGGVIDGSGSKWWAASCKINKTNPCKGAPTALTIDQCKGVRVKHLNFQYSQQIHFAISRSDSVRISGVRVTAPEDSPNTDGIHITESTNVAIQNVHIGTGDDCISIVNASSNIKMKNIKCGPGHGISIGSLGKDNSTAVVTAVVLDTAIITGTTNGVRIKTWQGGSGYVRGVKFQNVKMIDVQNPIIIDQFYCDSSTPCKNQTSAVKISGVIYKDITGTSKSPEAMKFACSDTVPCSGIVLNNINLEREDGIAQTYCNCAMGIDFGVVKPPADCLKNTACGGGDKEKYQSALVQVLAGDEIGTREKPTKTSGFRISNAETTTTFLLWPDSDQSLHPISSANAMSAAPQLILLASPNPPFPSSPPAFL
ncbi:hypothetical protein LUZ63_004122 [Rhynchospora breviuscula]|uniref:endo-polygalacturonase n=1 Tax=Rhynchospora breviuscula TaxID=2022672 RepID=A0A9Q0D2H3_9POAL|nr:hypothetical protein LUZ63_004122 [Rhynchospora breviuscula]